MGNSLNIELEGKHVVLDTKYLTESHHPLLKRIVLCTGGFGCSPATSGNALFVDWIADGLHSRVEGYMVQRLATDEEVKEAKELRANTFKDKLFISKNVCPYCESENIRDLDPDIEVDNTITRPFECKDCKKKWKAIYKLQRAEEYD